MPTRPARPAAHPNVPAGLEERRAFLQQRLALLGKAWALIVIGFYVLGNAVILPLPERERDSWLGHGSNQVLLANAGFSLAVWLVCRRGRFSRRTLRAIDATALLLNCLGYSLFVFAPYAGESAGEPQARMLLALTHTLVVRAVIVPSTSRRTLMLSLAAGALPVAAAFVQGVVHDEGTPGDIHAVWAALWSLGAAVVATLASHVIYGLRRQVRKAMQLGQYTLEEKIGEGGMGTVYRASHAMLRRPTAVKLLPPQKAGAERLERFEREVQLTSGLTHPNTVAIFDYGRTADGVFYYAMEYLEGLNLEELVRLDGPQPPGRVIHILRQVAGSLAEAHGVGLIHRDVKPANIILVPERGAAPDVAKVVDFGLVKDLDQRAEPTQDDRLTGTPLYLSPEAIRAPELVDARSDLYSLGAVGYLLLTGTRVFDGRNVVEICGHHLHTPPEPPAERVQRPMPASLSALLLSCLEKDASRRPASARALLAGLAACHDVTPWTEEEARTWWRRRPETGLQARRPPDRSQLSSGATLSVLLKGRSGQRSAR